ncbi:hypothetical protein RJ641_005967 [Dillenia turbinata]|uniref:U-box domain-containing protein n=1 Tax=Dillenia turbinata TaxID=194707 RepID=A0AAN8Z737_9MAGN
MKTQNNQPTKLKTPLFSCGFFRHCTQTVLSPTSPTPPSPPLLPSHPTPPPFSKSPPDPPPAQLPQSAIPPPRSPPPPRHDSTSSSSSSASTSQSFTQWRIPTTPHPPQHPPDNNTSQNTIPSPSSFEELFHIAELNFSTGTQPDFISALHLLDRCLVPNPTNPTSTTHPICPLSVMTSLLMSLKNPTTSKPATKVLLALCLHETNRRVAVDAGAVTEVVESLSGLSGAPAERALAVLELMCTVEEGAVELRENALSVPMMVEVMKRMEGRGREYAISVLSVIFCNGDGGGADAPPPEEVAKAVALALKGECSERGRRKGNQILNAVSESGRPDVCHVAND